MKMTIFLILVCLFFIFVPLLKFVPKIFWKIAVQINSADVDKKLNQLLYSKNYEEMNPDNLSGDEISNDLKVRKMIYFHKTKKFNRWLEKMKRKTIELSRYNQTVISFEGKNDRHKF